MADVMARHGVRGSVRLNVAVCDHYPEIIERCCELDWELFSHGTYNTRYFYGMIGGPAARRHPREPRDHPARLRAVDGRVADARHFQRRDDAGHPGRGRHPLYARPAARRPADAGRKVRATRLVSIPYSLEVNDVPLLVMRNTPPERYAEICKAQFDTLYEEGAESGTVMCMPLHPFLIGQPHRIAALEEVLRHVTSHDKVWLATGREIARHYIDHHLAAHEAWIAEGTP